MRRGIIGAVGALAVALPGGVAAQATKVGTFNEWTVYSSGAGKTKICFAAGAPKTGEPSTARRDPIYFYISAWPNDGVKSEISVKIGYAFKSGATATVTIGSSEFKLFTQGDKAFVSDATEELKLIEAMKKGSSMIVEGTSQRGTATKDTYSLAGIGQALQAVSAGCP
jgi:hypothetical protein